MKQHPHYPEIEVSSNGKIFFQGKELKPRKQKKCLVVYFNRNYRSAAKLILECYNPKPEDGKRYYALSKDGSLHPDKLYWSTIPMSKQEKIKADCHKSKIGITAMYSIHLRNKQKGRSKAFLAKENGVSPMSIKRAIDRLEKKIAL